MLLDRILATTALAAVTSLVSARAQPQRFGELRRMLPSSLDTTTDVALADVDGDGDLDVLVGNAPEQNRLYLNDGSGVLTDATAQLPPMLDNTAALALGDEDGDGDLDLLVGNFQEQNRLHLNDGSGVFADATAQIPASSDETRAVAVGDVDGDGDLDAWIGNSGQDRLYLNDGAGAFTDATAQLPAVLDSTSAVALGDVDGDGDLDALTGNFGQPDRLYLNDGAGVFSDATAQLPGVSGFTFAVALGDVDGDGDLDALIGNGQVIGQQDRLYLNSGVGVFTDATSQLPAILDDTLAVALGDVDGDGDLDALAGNAGQDRLYLNDGTGAFTDATAQLPAVLDGTLAVALGDVDGDGDLDLLAGNAGNPSGLLDRLYLNDGSGTFTEVTAQIPPRPDDTRVVTLADVDGDGDLDALVGNYFGQDRLYLNEGSGAFTDATTQLPAIVGRTWGVAVGDVDGDADLDALFANDVQLPRLYVNDGAGAFTDATAQLPPIGITGPGRAVALGDVDGDGDLDALLGNIGTDRLYLNDGSGVFSNTTGQLPSASFDTQAVALGDLDADGDLDALFGSGGVPGGEQNRLYLNDGSGLFTDATAQLPAIVDDTFAVALGDVEGDGDLDALVGNGSFLPGEQNRLLLNDGTGTFADGSAQLPALQDFTLAVALADTDEDGDLDALLGNFGQDRLLLNDGSGLFADATAMLPSADDNTRSVAAGDVDGDGDADVLLGNFAQVKLLSNLGRQLAWRGIPRIGKPLVLDVYGPSFGAWFLGVSTGAANLPIPPFGTLRLDPASLFFVFAGLLDAEGRVAVPIAVPANASLLGVPVYWPAVVAGPARFTNLEITTATNL